MSEQDNTPTDETEDTAEGEIVAQEGGEEMAFTPGLETLFASQDHFGCTAQTQGLVLSEQAARLLIMLENVADEQISTRLGLLATAMTEYAIQTIAIEAAEAFIKAKKAGLLDREDAPAPVKNPSGLVLAYSKEPIA